MDIRPPLWLLKLKGLTLGRHAYVDKRAYIDWEYAHLITIEDWAIVAAGVVVVAHDASTLRPLRYKTVGRVRIGRYVFIGANSVVLPGVDIGDMSIVGAGTVVAKDVPAGVVVYGNPMKIYSTVDGFKSRRQQPDSDWPAGGPVAA